MTYAALSDCMHAKLPINSKSYSKKVTINSKSFVSNWPQIGAPLITGYFGRKNRKLTSAYTNNCTRRHLVSYTFMYNFLVDEHFDTSCEYVILSLLRWAYKLTKHYGCNNSSKCKKLYS
jgi:hypothetical protein